jgi:hypothetical protein
MNAAELVHQRIALRRIHDGGVVRLNWRYLDKGAPVPVYLPYVFNCFIHQGIVALGEPEPAMANARRLHLTLDGLALHALMCGSSPSRPAGRGRGMTPGGPQTTSHIAASADLVASEFPVITLPSPALGKGAGRVSGAVGPGGPAPGLVPPRPIHARSPR